VVELMWATYNEDKDQATLIQSLLNPCPSLLKAASWSSLAQGKLESALAPGVRLGIADRVIFRASA